MPLGNMTISLTDRARCLLASLLVPPFGKAGNLALAAYFREIYDLSNALREMANYKGIMAVIRDAAKKKGMRFNVADFPDGDVESPNEHVAIFRGEACKFLDRLFKCGEYSVARKPVRKGHRPKRAGLKNLPYLLKGLRRKVHAHNVMMTNYDSATASRLSRIEPSTFLLGCKLLITSLIRVYLQRLVRISPADIFPSLCA